MDNIGCMAYVDKIKSGKKTFYYLGKTIRIGENKWKKISELTVEKDEKNPYKHSFAVYEKMS